MKKKISIKSIWTILKNSAAGFSQNKVLKLSASLAYYTIFALAPLLIIIISLSGIFLGQEAVQGKVYAQLSDFLGSDSAFQLQEIIKNASIADKSKLAAIIGGVTLLIGATTVFAEIQESINMIWGLKPKPKKGWLKMLKNRFLSFSIIISLGFLLLVSLIITTLIDGLSNSLRAHFPEVALIIFYIFNLIITLAVITLIFGVIFKVLPDAIIKWKDVLAGAIATGLLFMIGKFGISFYISKSNVGSTYGAAGSLVIILLWVYYSAIILYFGAEFTKAYAVEFGSQIHPDDYAVTTKTVEVETGKKTVQQKENTDIKTIKTPKK